MTYVLALTGGIATGKSTADKFFKRQGIPVIDCDQITHDLMKVGEPIWRAIKQNFGQQYLRNDQTINRPKLAQLVFHDARALNKLNQLTLPLILAKTRQKIAASQGEKIIVLDAPTYFEAGWEQENLADRVLVISLPQSLQIKRLCQRNHLTVQAARARINSQLSLAKKAKKADYVIANTGTVKELEHQLSKLLDQIKKEG